jgi:lipopolysaccharide transport system ATP-binding protein
MTRDNEVAVAVENLSKQYGLPPIPMARNILNVIPGIKKRSAHTVRPWALDDISFEVRRGEILGIIGRNGSGKSTLLKLLAGVTPHSRGLIRVSGRIFPMIELSAGIHPELTGKENAFILGAIMGLTKSEIIRRLPAIEEFSELGGWFYKPVRTYSSGMYARLGFSVAMNVDADVLLVDEVLAVGDTAFQRKCYDRLSYLEKKGVTILFVSHNIRQVERISTSVIWLDSGKIIMEGNPTEVAQAYYKQADEELLKRARKAFTEEAKTKPERSDKEIRIVTARLLDEAENPVDTVEMFKPITIELEFVCYERVRSPGFTLGFHTTDLVNVTSFSTAYLKKTPDFDPGTHRIRCRIPSVILNPGVYGIRAGIGSDTQWRAIDSTYGLSIFQVTSDDFKVIEQGVGLVFTKARWFFDF